MTTTKSRCLCPRCHKNCHCHLVRYHLLKKIENGELKDEHIQWLEEQLASLNKEFGRRTGIIIPPEKAGKEKGEKGDKDTDDSEELDW